MNIRNKRRRKFVQIYYIISISLIIELLNMIQPPVYTKITPFDPEVLISLNCNNPNCERAYYNYNKWGLNFMKRFPKSKVILTSTNKSINPDIVLEAQYMNEKIWYRQMYYNNYALYRHFLKSKYKFLYRCTEDVYIDANNLAKTILDIKLRNMTYTFCGQYVPGENESLGKFGFMHGGPGWIMNKDSARYWVRNKKIFDALWEFHSQIGDDVIVEEFFKMEDIPKNDIHVDSFMGWPMHFEDIQKLEKREWNKFGKCPQMENEFTKPILVKNIAAWHSGLPIPFIYEHADEIIREAPENLYAMSCDKHTVLCYLT